MKVYNIVQVGEIDFTKKSKWWQFWKRWYVSNCSGGLIIYTSVGIFYCSWEKGFGCDGRSGGIFVDPIFPNWGTKDQKKPIIAHDISFFDWFGITFELCNDLLKGMMEYYNVSQWRCDAVYKGVSTWIAKRAFGCKTKEEKENKKLCEMRYFKK